MSYILKAQFYGNKSSATIKKFPEYVDAVQIAQWTAGILNKVMVLTRHSSIRGAESRCDYYADLYNEVGITVEKQK